MELDDPHPHTLLLSCINELASRSSEQSHTSLLPGRREINSINASLSAKYFLSHTRLSLWGAVQFNVTVQLAGTAIASADEAMIG